MANCNNAIHTNSQKRNEQQTNSVHSTALHLKKSKDILLNRIVNGTDLADEGVLENLGKRTINPYTPIDTMAGVSPSLFHLRSGSRNWYESPGNPLTMEKYFNNQEKKADGEKKSKRLALDGGKQTPFKRNQSSMKWVIPPWSTRKSLGFPCLHIKKPGNHINKTGEKENETEENLISYTFPSLNSYRAFMLEVSTNLDTKRTLGTRDESQVRNRLQRIFSRALHKRKIKILNDTSITGSFSCTNGYDPYSFVPCSKEVVTSDNSKILAPWYESRNSSVAVAYPFQNCPQHVHQLGLSKPFDELEQGHDDGYSDFSPFFNAFSKSDLSPKKNKNSAKPTVQNPYNPHFCGIPQKYHRCHKEVRAEEGFAGGVMPYDANKHGLLNVASGTRAALLAWITESWSLLKNNPMLGLEYPKNFKAQYDEPLESSFQGK